MKTHPAIRPILTILLFAPLSLSAQTWQPAGGGNWNLNTNWDPAVVPDAVDAAVAVNVNNAQTINLQGGTYDIGSLTSSGSTNTTTFSNGTLNLAVTTGTPLLDIAKSTTISAALSGTQGFEKTGGSLLTLSGDNSSLSGVVTISQGTIAVTQASAGNASYVMAGNTTLRFTGADGVLGNDISMTGSGMAFLEFPGSATRAVASHITVQSGQTLRALDLGSPSLAPAVTWEGKLTGSGTFQLTNGQGRYILDMDASDFTGNFSSGSGGVFRILVARDNAFGLNNTLTAGGNNPILSSNTEARTLNSSLEWALNVGGMRFGDDTNFPDNTGKLTFTGGILHQQNANRVINVDGESMVVEIQGAFTSGFAGNNDFRKIGAGTLILSGTGSNYARNTIVSDGTLIVNGEIVNPSSGVGTRTFTVSAGATLGGSGSIAGRPMTINGVLSPGNSIGTLTVESNVTWNFNTDNEWVFELGTAGSSILDPGTSDRLAITGNFLKGTGDDFIFDFANTGEAGWYQLISWTGTGASFDVSDFMATNLGGSLTGEFTLASNGLYLEVIPEPSTGLLLLVGAGLLALRRRTVLRQR